MTVPRSFLRGTRRAITGGMTGRLLRRALPVAAAALAGCITTQPQQQTTRYWLAVSAPPALRGGAGPVVLEQATGRAAYLRPYMVVTLPAFQVDRYVRYEWADSPVNMLHETLFSYLSQRGFAVLRATSGAKSGTEPVLSVYVDAMDEEIDNGAATAVLRIRYDIRTPGPAGGQASRWFERRTPLSSAGVDAYVAAQNDAVREFLLAVSDELAK